MIATKSQRDYDMTDSNEHPNHLRSLHKIELFSGLSTHTLAELCGLMRQVNFKKNSLVITQGENTRSLFVITSGRLKVFANNEEGDQTIFTFMGAGDFFGELSLLDDAPRSASVIAVEDSTGYSLSHQNFNTFLNHHPEVCQSLFKALTTRIRQMDETICNLSSRDIYGRLIQVLYKEAVPQDDGRLITLRFTHQDLAEMIGSSREMVSRILTDLRKGGYISVDKKRIIIEKKLPEQW